MRKLAVFVAVWIVGLTVAGYSWTMVIDPLNPDTVIIGRDAVRVGEQAVIPIEVVTDEFVDYINIPVHYDNQALSFDRCVFEGQAVGWDDTTSRDRPGYSMVTVFGWTNVMGDPNPYFNTYGQREVIVRLYFNVLPGTNLGTYPLEITTDPLNGFLVFGDTNGFDSWVPEYENGYIQVVNEEGFADSVYVESNSVLIGNQAAVPIGVVNDEDVSQFTIPVSFDGDNFSFVGYQLSGDIATWDNVTVEQTPGTEIIAIVGQKAEADPFLNTGGIGEEVVELYFATNPAAPEGNYPFEFVTDPIYGPLTFYSISGPGWNPFSRNGFINLYLPPSCDMQYDYLWAYGFCQSPSDNRQYACRVRNYGVDPAENVVLTIALPDTFIYQGSSPAAIVVDNVMTWNLGTIEVGGSIRVDWWVDIPDSIGNDTVITVADIVTSTDDVDPLNNHREFIEIVGFSYDPNDKTIDPYGYGAERFVDRNNILTYTVYFENSEEATLPATDILVKDTLSAKLDWASFVAGPMSHPDPCSVWIDQGTGVVTCFCDDIFLPPNVNPPEGEGSFSFSIFPRWNVATGDVIENRAYIRIDINPWIAAPELAPVSVTMDVTRPVSTVLPLPDFMYNPSYFDVYWEGNDGLGSGITYYDIYMAQDGEPFGIWIDHTTSTSATFYPQLDHAYAFYSIATDNLGMVENAPLRPDAVTTVLGGCQYTIGDVNGNPPANGIDVVYMVNFFKGGPPPPVDCFIYCPNQSNPFYASGDVNGGCNFNGIDVTYYVNYLKGGPPLTYCPDCPPAGGR